jgi:hypothetical protein
MSDLSFLIHCTIHFSYALFLFLLKIGWDESAAGDRPSRVSVWDIEPVLTPFYICPPPFFRPRFSGQPGMPGKFLYHFISTQLL